MEIKENDMDRLTRGLLKDTAEQPSPSLNARIMTLIMQEKRKVYTYYVKKQFTPMGIFIQFVVYMLIVAGFMMGANASKGEAGFLLGALKSYFPVLLTVASAISFFFLFTQLDNWMKREELRRKRSSGY